MNLKFTSKKNLKKYFEDNGYIIIKSFFQKKSVKFLKIITKYANKDFAPIMNPDRLEYLISQLTKKIDSLKDLGAKVNLINSLQKDCKYFRSVMLNPKILKLLSKIKNKKKISALMSQMIFKQVNSKFSKQSWEPHQDNSYILNKKVNI